MIELGFDLVCGIDNLRVEQYSIVDERYKNVDTTDWWNGREVPKLEKPGVMESWQLTYNKKLNEYQYINHNIGSRTGEDVIYYNPDEGIIGYRISSGYGDPWINALVSMHPIYEEDSYERLNPNKYFKESTGLYIAITQHIFKWIGLDVEDEELYLMLCWNWS